MSARRGFLVWLAAVVAWGLLLFCYHYLGELAGGGSVPYQAPLVNEFSGALAAGVLFLPVVWICRRLPLGRAVWLRRLPAYLGAAGAFCALHTTLMWGQRELVYPLAGLGDYDYGRMPLRYFMEAPMQTIGFTVMVGAIHGLRGLRRAREREVRTAQLEKGLAQAQLRALRLQLQPHFLFNALNTISATMYTDPAAADEILDQLAELLRAALRTAQTDEVPLGEELEILNSYLGILRARFGERLRLATSLEPGLDRALVPSLLLQPLVENAVRHGHVETLGRGAITIRARHQDGRLVVEVEDDGPGAPAGRDPLSSGVGLAATAERLQLLYGENQRLEVESPAGGGFRVRVWVPLRGTA